MNDLNAKAKQAAESFLSRRGYDILDDGWEDPSGIVDIVAREGDVLVFAEVTVTRDSSRGFPRERSDEGCRAAREASALAYLAEHDVTDMMVRFDTVSLVVLGSDRALVRHHINCLSVGIPQQELSSESNLQALPEAA